MKFTVEEAIQRLNALLTNDGKKPLRMSERTLKENTETLLTLVATDEMELEDFVTKVSPMLNSVNSNIEHDVADAYKRINPSTPPTPPVPPAPTNPPTAPTTGDDELALLRQELEQIKAERASEKAAQTLALKKKEIKRYLKDNNCDDNDWAEKVISLTTISVDDDAEAKGKDILALYNKSKAAGVTITPVTPEPGAKGNGAFDDLIAFRKARNPQKA